MKARTVIKNCWMPFVNVLYGVNERIAEENLEGKYEPQIYNGFSVGFGLGFALTNAIHLSLEAHHSLSSKSAKILEKSLSIL